MPQMKMVQSLIALACLLAGADAFGANPTKPIDGPPAFIVYEGVGWCSSDLDENDSVMWKGSTSVVDKTADDCWKECQAEFPQNQEPLLQFYNDGVDTWCICKDGCECMNDVGKDATLAPPDWEAPSACPSPPSPPPPSPPSPSPPPPSPSYDFIADKAELQAALSASGFTDDGNDYVITEKYGPIAGWDTSRVEDMSSLFAVRSARSDRACPLPAILPAAGSSLHAACAAATIPRPPSPPALHAAPSSHAPAFHSAGLDRVQRRHIELGHVWRHGHVAHV